MKYLFLLFVWYIYNVDGQGQDNNLGFQLFSPINAGNIDLVKSFIDRGANVNVATSDGWTPAHAAAENGHLDILKLLIKHGANINAGNHVEWTPFHSAANRGTAEMVEYLIKNGANVNALNNIEITPLYSAVERGDVKIVELLLRNGADRNIKSNEGRSAFDLGQGNPRIVELFKRIPSNTTTEKDNMNSIELTVSVDRPAVKACQVYTSNRIINGQDASPNEFPWMAALGYLDSNLTVNFNCGGTIISSRFVLTAAHCVSPQAPVVIRLGTITLIKDNYVRKSDYQIEQTIKHPSYSLLSKKNDIALLRVRKVIQFTDEITAACLETDMRDKPAHVKLIVTGWGLTSDESSSKSNNLKKVQLTSMPLHQCNSRYMEWNKIVNAPAFRNGLFDGQYCAYDPANKSDSCQGDSGGPLQYFKNSTSIANIVGVVSFGIVCGGSDLAGIYTRVAYYMDWIESYVWTENTIDVE